MPTPEELRALWPGLDDDQRRIVRAVEALLEALQGQRVEWLAWTIGVLEARLPDEPELEAEDQHLGDLSVWEAAIENWEDV